MRQNILKDTQDPMGAAIMDFHKTGRADRLVVKSSMFDDDEIPVATLFRDFDQMSELEKIALKEAKGKILDVGAGSGCHSLALQSMNKTVSAVDISPLAVQAMRERGVKNVKHQDFFDSSFTQKYDTLIMLMNGTGIIGRIDNLDDFFSRLDNLLYQDCQLLIDSSDLKYLFEEEDGSFLIDINDNYYGEVDFLMQYKGVVGNPFDWLYIDAETFSFYAKKNGFNFTVIAEGEHYDYLAKIEKCK